MAEFTLRPQALEWRLGRRQGHIRYDRIAAVRLSYRPLTMQSQRFVAEIWSPDSPKIQIASVSWRSMVDQQRQDHAYRAFIVELHRRIAATGRAVDFSSGRQPVLYWIGVALFSAVIAAIVMMTAWMAWAMRWDGAAIVGAFFVIFTWQAGSYFHRNRPARYQPDRIPPSVMPRATE
jgi:hypothetical protein